MTLLSLIILFCEQMGLNHTKSSDPKDFMQGELSSSDWKMDEWGRFLLYRLRDSNPDEYPENMYIHGLDLHNKTGVESAASWGPKLAHGFAK